MDVVVNLRSRTRDFFPRLRPDDRPVQKPLGRFVLKVERSTMGTEEVLFTDMRS